MISGVLLFSLLLSFPYFSLLIISYQPFHIAMNYVERLFLQCVFCIHIIRHGCVLDLS